MRKCWAIVQDEFPWISIAPCQTHCPSLLVGDIAKLPAPAQTIKDETLVVAWFTNHHKPLSILRNKVQQVFGKSKELKKAGATRMGTNTWVGERLSELKSCLQQVVVDPEYIKENYKDSLPAGTWPGHPASYAGLRSPRPASRAAPPAERGPQQQQAQQQWLSE